MDVFSVGEFATNCFVVRAHDGAADAALVDPGAEPERLRHELVRLGVRPSAILVTHTDVDHVEALAELAENYGAEVWCPADEAHVLREPRSSIRPLAQESDVRPYDPEHVLIGGDRFTVAGLDFRVIETPGHSPGHIAFHTEGAVFSGDLVFADRLGHARHPGGDANELRVSVETLLRTLPPETVVYTGHGASTTLGAVERLLVDP